MDWSPPELRFDPASQQRAVFDWHEGHKIHEDADIDQVLSLEWGDSIKSWTDIAAAECGDQDLDAAIASFETHPQDLEFGVFFVAHPIAAFSVWLMLQACFDLDETICATTPENMIEVRSWRGMRFFQYFLSDRVKSLWSEELSTLARRIGRGVHADLADEQRLYAIAPRVSRLEELRSSLEENLASNVRKTGGAAWVVNPILAAVDDRRNLIEQFLVSLRKVPKEVETPEKEMAKLNGHGAKSAYRDTAESRANSTSRDPQVGIKRTPSIEAEQLWHSVSKDTADVPILQFQIGNLMIKVLSPFPDNVVDYTDLWLWQMQSPTAIWILIFLTVPILALATVTGAVFSPYIL